VTTDELHLFFARDGVIMMAHRTTPDGVFESAVDAGAFNTPYLKIPTWISPDGCRLYLEVWDGEPVLHLAQRPQ
jgi:hypothetical protein